MATIGNLMVNLGLNSKGFTTGLSTSQKALAGFSNGISKFAGLAGGVTAALGGMFAVGNLGSWTSAAFSSIDANEKLARSLGVAGAELEGLKHAADLSGVSTEALTVAMRKAQLTEPDATFGNIAKRIAGIEDPADRAAEAVRIFGRAGQQLMPMFQGGTDALRDMVDEGMRLRGVSPVDAVAIENANDSITRMQTAFQSVGRALAVSVAPMLEQTANYIRTFIPSVGVLVEQFTWWGQIARQTIPIIGGIASAMLAITAVQKSIAVGQALILSLSGPKGWGVLFLAAGAAAGAYAGIDYAIDGVTDRARAATEQASQLDNALSQFSGNTDGLDAFSQGATAAGRKITGLQRDIELLQSPENLRGLVAMKHEFEDLRASGVGEDEINTIRDLTAQQNRLLELQKKRSDEQERLNSLTSDLQGRLDGLRSPVEMFNADIDKFREGLASGILTQADFDKLALDAIQKRNEGLGIKPDVSTETGGPAKAIAGTVDAYRLITDASNAQDAAAKRYAYEKRMEKLANEQLAAVKTGNTLLAGLAVDPEEADF